MIRALMMEGIFQKSLIFFTTKVAWVDINEESTQQIAIRLQIYAEI
jgi:hypothetical protein